MKKIMLAITLLVAAVAQSQAPQPLPKELDVFKSLVGTWKGQLTMGGGATDSQVQDTMVCRMGIGGRYFIAEHAMDMPGMGKFEGMEVVTFEPERKKYVSHWYDSMEAGAMEMEGTMTGNTLVLASKPTKMAAMGGQMVEMRNSLTIENAKRLKFKLEMKMGNEWSTMMEGTYTKS